MRFLVDISCIDSSTRASGAENARQAIFSSLTDIAVSISGA